MKKFTLSFVIVLFACFAFAQNKAIENIKGREFSKPVIKSHKSLDKIDPSTFYIDYNEYEYNLYKPDYGAYWWDMNKNYSLAAGDTAFTYCAVSFNKIYNTTDDVEIPTAQIQSLKVDSLWASVIHVNNSATANKFVFKIVSLYGTNGYPSPSAILWKDTVTVDFSLSGTDWSPMAIGVKPDYTVAAKKFGVILEFWGDKTKDSCWFYAGWGDRGQCKAGMDHSAVKSQFYPNSYAYWMKYSQQIPSASGQDLYYDCNGNGTQDNDGSDAANFIQNIGLWAKVTAPNTVGINDAKKSSILNVYPNPAKNSLTISNVGENAKVSIVNALGQVIYNSVIDNNTVINTSDLNNGVYFVRVNENVTRVIIQK